MLFNPSGPGYSLSLQQEYGGIPVSDFTTGIVPQLKVLKDGFLLQIALLNRPSIMLPLGKNICILPITIPKASYPLSQLPL
jgi:hypothetical protein